MLCQLGLAFANLIQLGASKLVPAVGTAALDIGSRYVSGLVNKELNRGSRNEFEADIKAALRAAANAVTPTVAPGQTAVYSGGPPVGSAYRPPTLIPPSIEPPLRVLHIDPGLSDPVVSNAFDLSRRPPGAFGAPIQETSANRARRLGLDLPQISVIDPSLLDFPGTQPAFAGGLVTGAIKLGQRLRRGAAAFDPRTPTGRRMIGAAAGGVAVETAAQVGLSGLFPQTAFAPGGDPLRLGGIGAPLPTRTLPQIPTGLPGVGRFEREANGCRVQWYFWDGSMDMQPVPIDRADSKNFRRDAIFRLDVFRGKFIKLGSRRMNPMNVRAFFRAGRRVDAGERICRKMFSEKRKQKTGTIRRKTRKRKK